MESRLHVIVSGLVQGVFFRANTKETAQDLELKGWVKNTANGKVEALFEGKKEDLKRMLEFCKRGPEGSNVTRVDIEWGDSRQEFKDFQIRY